MKPPGHVETFVYRMKPPGHVENVIVMVNNAGDVFALTQKENTSFTVDVRIIFDINDI